MQCISLYSPFLIPTCWEIKDKNLQISNIHVQKYKPNENNMNLFNQQQALYVSKLQYDFILEHKYARKKYRTVFGTELEIEPNPSNERKGQ